jgi:uncharacterized coiled-coil DUF342 family protein
MFVSWKKLCKIAQEEAEAWRKIATGKAERIEELLEQIKDLYDRQADMYNHCRELKHDRDEWFAHCQELEAELERARQDNQRWADDFEELDIAYGELEIERDRYKERVEAFEEGKYPTREAE